MKKCNHKGEKGFKDLVNFELVYHSQSVLCADEGNKTDGSDLQEAVIAYGAIYEWIPLLLFHYLLHSFLSGVY